jgi:uncharacterized protein YfaS (alpha-2-macroglobulin family)
MRSKGLGWLVLGALLGVGLVTRAAEGLRVIQTGPNGELASLAEAGEIRVLFSRPMVELGRIPDVVTAPFFKVEPPIKGSFRWSGTRLLIFTADHAEKLPYCTKYTVTIAPSAASVEGERLDQPATFSFTTPTVKLINAQWYRKGGRYDAPAVLCLRFNQPVDPKAVVAHLKLAFTPREWTAPELQRAVLPRMAKENPQAFREFQSKIASATLAANSKKEVPFVLAKEWDSKRFKPGDDLVVLETTSAPPPQSQIQLRLDEKLPGVQGSATPAASQSYAFVLEPAFFVDRLYCSDGCSVEFYNSLDLTRPVSVKALLPHLTVVDVTNPAQEVPVKPGRPGAEPDEEGGDEGAPGLDFERTRLSMDLLGLKLEPAHTYVFKVDKDLQAKDGQKLGYDWYGQVAYMHNSAFTSFGEGHGVWEAAGGPQLPFYSRNLTKVQEWLAPVKIGDLVPAALAVEGLRWKGNDVFERIPLEQRLPPVEPKLRDLKPQPDVIESVGLNIAGLLNAEGKGLVWAALLGQEAIPKAYHVESRPNPTLVQVTNLGISVKDSPQNTLILVTRLDDASPVEGAEVVLRTPGNEVVWKGLTDKSGVAMAPASDLRLRRFRFAEEDDYRADWSDEDYWSSWWIQTEAPRFVVTATKGGDTAYLLSNWNEGLEPWQFGYSYNLGEAKPLLRGTVFSDRGVYKLGEEVHFKAVLRADTADGMRLLPEGTTVAVVLKDSQDKEIDKRTVALSAFGGADWAVKLPEDGPLGRYFVSAKVEGQRRSVGGDLLVAAYRKPEFRVDANVGGTDDLAGAMLKGVVTGRYLFGAPMGGRQVKLRAGKSRLHDVPKAVRERFPEERYAFLREAWEEGGGWEEQELFTKEATLGPDGSISVDIPTDAKAGEPVAYTLEGEVTDVSRQTLAGRASFPVHPAPWYLGVVRPSYFVQQKDGLSTEVVAVTPRGETAPKVKVSASLVQVQWNSVRRAEGNGFYTWDVQRVEKERWKGSVETGAEPAALQVPVPEGGYYILRLTASDPEGRSTTTTVDFYALGEGYAAWARYDGNRIDLVPEKKTYKPGETARILIKSPWEKATAVLTTEREGIRTHQEFRLTSTMQTVTVPITQKEIPNIYVSVLLLQGRTSTTLDKGGEDPGKPAFRVGYAELKVENQGKRLAVEVKSDKEEYRPQEKAKIEVSVTDVDGGPDSAEVTLWAVDYGVLSLTGYKTPDVLDSVWVEKALQVATEDSREKIISRRVVTPKGAEEGGGGGFDEGAENKARKDFRVLAFWLGAGVTDKNGRLVTEQKLPDSLTTYRVMAVVQDREHRFGWAQREIRLSKPVLLTPAFPRFLALGDKAFFGAVVHNQLKEAGAAMVTLKSLTPDLLSVNDGPLSLDVPAQGAAEARFHVQAKGAGTGMLLATVKLKGEEDSFELPLPVRLLVSPETVAAYGQAPPEGRESVRLPEGVVPGVGGLHVELSSTAMVGLGEGASYLVDYPYGCAEQKASCALALLLTADLGDAFRLPGIKPEELKAITQKTLKDLEQFQCDDGGFRYWKDCPCWLTSPYLTSYVAHVFQRGVKLGYSVGPNVLPKAYDYLERDLGEPRPDNEAFMPAYTAWQAFACKVLTEGGRTEDSHVTRLYGYRDHMPVFGLCNLWDAMAASGEKGGRPEELKRRLLNAVLPEGGTSHVEELNDPYLLWFWNSNVRSTAMGLGSLVRNSDDAALVPGFVRWLMKARKDGRWGNTQENAWALESLVDYYRKVEKEIPDFTAVAALGAKTLLSETFKGRETAVRSADLPMPDLLAQGKAGEPIPLTFNRTGTGTLFYAARLKYAADPLFQKGLDQGIFVKRTYEPFKGGDAGSSFQAGDLVRVVLEFDLTKERRWMAVTDPIPAGFEPVESWFATTSRELAQDQQGEESQQGDWTAWWKGGGFDHVERHDDRVLLFATRLAQGRHTFRYVCRATTAGTFRTAPCHAEEMYEPEVFGRTATDVVEVKEK